MAMETKIHISFWIITQIYTTEEKNFRNLTEDGEREAESDQSRELHKQ